MNQGTAEIVIGVVTFFCTTLVNAFVLGMYLGGFKSELRMMSDRLAKIEGVFTLVPRRGGDGGEILRSVPVELDSDRRTVCHL